MQLRSLILVAVFLAIILTCFWYKQPSPTDASQKVPGSIIPEKVPGSIITENRHMLPDRKTTEVGKEKYIWSEKKRPRLETIEGYLNENGRTCHNLIGAYDLTGDEEFLKEALLAYPNAVELLTLALSVPSAELLVSRKEATGRLLKSDPENSVGNFLQASQLLKEGKVEEAIKNFQIGAKGKVELFEDQRREKLVDILSFANVSDPDLASRQIGFALPDGFTSEADRMVSFLKTNITESVIQGDMDSAIANVEAVLGYGESLRIRGGASLMLESEANRQVIDVLSSLDEEVPYGESSTAREQVKKLIARQIELSRALDGGAHFEAFFAYASLSELERFDQLVAEGDQVGAQLHMADVVDAIKREIAE